MSQRPQSIHKENQGFSFWMALTLLFSLIFVAMALAPQAVAQTEPAVEEDNWISMRGDAWNTGASNSLAPDTDELYWIFEAPPHSVLGWTFWYGAVAVHDHIVYAGHSNGNLYAIDESSGSILWEYLIDDYAEDFPFPILSSPVIDVERETIYLGADGLYAIDMNDGTLKWKFDTEFWFEWWSSPNLEDDTIYFGSIGGFLFAIDADTGTELWRFETGEREYNPSNGQELNKEEGGEITATPAIGPDYVYIVDWDENLYAVNKADGELVFYQGFEDAFPGTQTPMEWGPFDMGAGEGYASVALDLDNHMMFIGDTSGNMWGLSMDPDDNGWDDDFDGRTDNEGKVEWEYNANDQIWSASASVYDNTVYAGSWDGTLYAFEPVSGTIQWEAVLHGTPYGSQIAADGMIYAPTFANEGGSWVGYTTAYDASSGDELWSLKITDPILAQPAVYNDKFIIGDWFGSHLIAIGSGGPKPDLFVDDLTVSDANDNDERIVYATVGNKPNTVVSPPFDVQIKVDGELMYNESFASLAPGDLAAANVKLDMGGGSHDIEVKIIQRPTGWYHIEEVNLANNEESIKVGGIFAAAAGESAFALPLWFILGLLIGFCLAWFFVGGREKEEREYLPHVAEIQETPLVSGKNIKIDWENIEYVTSKKAKRYHMADCPFAVNIPEKSRILMNFKKASKSSKKPCKCTEIKSAHDISYRHAKDAETGEEIVDGLKDEAILDAEQG